MNLKLLRKEFRADGIFSELHDEEGGLVAVTLEHAYGVTSKDPNRAWVPKLPDGGYTCVRGQHMLHGMNAYFTTFEIASVPNHTGILFHWGNFNSDSEGCVLLGDRLGIIGGRKAVLNSRAKFQEFMLLQDGVDSFHLEVKSA